MSNWNNNNSLSRQIASMFRQYQGFYIEPEKGKRAPVSTSRQPAGRMAAVPKSEYPGQDTAISYGTQLRQANDYLRPMQRPVHNNGVEMVGGKYASMDK